MPTDPDKLDRILRELADIGRSLDEQRKKIEEARRHAGETDAQIEEIRRQMAAKPPDGATRRGPPPSSGR